MQHWRIFRGIVNGYACGKIGLIHCILCLFMVSNLYADATVLSAKPAQTFQLDFSAPAPAPAPAPVQHQTAPPATSASAKPAPKAAPVHKQQQHTTILHGNPQSKIFHYAACRYYNCKLCTVIFASVQEAQAQGYRACSRCGKGK